MSTISGFQLMHRDHIHSVWFIIRNFWSLCQLKFAKAQKISCLQHFHVPFHFLSIYFMSFSTTPYTCYFNDNNTICKLFHNSKGYPVHQICMLFQWNSLFTCGSAFFCVLSLWMAWFFMCGYRFSQIKLNSPWL
jgi:hypothetical protein